MTPPTSGLRADLLLHIPHASTVIPLDDRARFAIGDAELNLELLKVTDWFTDDLFDLDDSERLVFGVSRLLVDPERFSDDAQEIMAERGLGAVYTRTHDGRLLKSSEDRDQLLARFYAPHHRALNAWAAAALDTHGRCLIIDCHSFPSRPLACDLDQTLERPDFCIGSVEFHTPASLVKAATATIESLTHSVTGARYTVLENRPYAGSIVPADFFGRDPRVCSVMIEANRALYMDENTGERLVGYPAFMADLKRVLKSVADAWADETLALAIWENVDLELGIAPVTHRFENSEIGRIVEALSEMKGESSWNVPVQLLFATTLLEASRGMRSLIEFLRENERVPMYTANWVVTTIMKKLKSYEKSSFSESRRVGAGEYAVEVNSYFVPGCGVFRLEFVGSDEIELHGIELGNLTHERAIEWISAQRADQCPDWFEDPDDVEEDSEDAE